MNNKKEEINLGGFPPIFIINKQIKNIKEFSKKNNIKKKDETVNLINVFNIKNILNSVKK
jgi:hypothetical protein